MAEFNQLQLMRNPCNLLSRIVSNGKFGKNLGMFDKLAQNPYEKGQQFIFHDLLSLTFRQFQEPIMSRVP